MTIQQKSQNKKKEIIDKDMLFRKCFVYALDIIQYNELLEKMNKHNIAKQLLKTTTEFSSYINEAKHSKSTIIFEKNIEKSIKKAQKSKLLLLLCKYSNTYPNPYKLISDLDMLIEEISLFTNF